MNSFEILQAKRALIAMLRARPACSMVASEAVDSLRQAGHRVSRDVLEVLVRGSADSPLELTSDGIVRLVRGVE